MRVSASANIISDTNPGAIQSGLLFILNQAQNAKQPPISPNAASAYQSSEVNPKVLRLRYDLGNRAGLSNGDSPLAIRGREGAKAILLEELPESD